MTRLIEENQGIAAAVATIGVSWLTKYFSLDTTLYGPLHLVSTKVVKVAADSFSSPNSLDASSLILNYSWLLAICALVIGLYYWRERALNFFRCCCCRKTSVLELTRPRDIAAWQSYIERNPDMIVSQPTNVRCFDSQVSKEPGALMFLPCVNEEVRFYDRENNVRGSFMFTTQKKQKTKSRPHYRSRRKQREDESEDDEGEKQQEERESSNEKLILYVRGRAPEYFKIVAQNSVNNDSDSLVHARCVIEKIESDTGKPQFETDWLYTTLDPRPKEDRLSSAWDGYFHPHLNDIKEDLALVSDKMTCYHPCNIRHLGYIFYGPPGSGKSDLMRRMALATNRHIVSMDMRSMTTSEIFHRIHFPQVGNSTTDAGNVIFLFDEFDATIAFLSQNEKMREAERKRGLAFALQPPDPFQLVKKATTEQTEMMSDSEDNSDEHKSKSSRKSTSKMTHGSGLPFVPPMMGLTESDGLMTLSLLKEMFQGASCPAGAIFVAATNYLEKIEELCPELVRPGRLTPIPFDYWDSEDIQELARYFWNCELENFPTHIATKPKSFNSLVMGWAKQLKDDPDGHIQFRTRILECLGQKDTYTYEIE